MKYTASVSKSELGINTTRLDGDRSLQPEHRNMVIDKVKEQATASGWTVRVVDLYEEFSAQDLSAGRVTLDVEQR